MGTNTKAVVLHGRQRFPDSEYLVYTGTGLWRIKPKEGSHFTVGLLLKAFLKRHEDSSSNCKART
jgi:hypothetical protein